MRVGILTFHRAHNYGAVLQAYALQYELNKLGMQCSIVDYRCRKIEDSYRSFLMERGTVKQVLSAAYHFPNRYIRKKKFENFCDQYLPISSIVYTRKNIQDAVEEYDCFVTGSDQVWNEELTGNDKTYFLDFVKDQKKISYAASLGTEHFSKSQIEEYPALLRNFDHISVREKNAQSLLSHLLNRKVQLVADPVFLLTKNEWMTFISKNTRGKYIFMYQLHEKNTKKLAEIISAKTGLKILTIPNDLRWNISTEKIFAPSVKEFLNLIYHAEYVITDSFHVTAFSMIFNKNYYGLLKMNSNIRELNGRLKTLVESLGVTNRLFEQVDNIEVGDDINFVNINKRIEDLRRAAIKYILSWEIEN